SVSRRHGVRTRQLRRLPTGGAGRQERVDLDRRFAQSREQVGGTMHRASLICASALLLGSAAFADDGVKAQSGGAAQAKSAKQPAGDVTMSGMSILGNDEAPKSLVLVPWKSSQLGDMPALSRLPDDSIKPVDKDVFGRELSYYQ